MSFKNSKIGQIDSFMRLCPFLLSIFDHFSYLRNVCSILDNFQRNFWLFSLFISKIGKFEKYSLLEICTFLLFLITQNHPSISLLKIIHVLFLRIDTRPQGGSGRMVQKRRDECRPQTLMLKMRWIRTPMKT
jgi:hypothetical protein